MLPGLTVFLLAIPAAQPILVLDARQLSWDSRCTIEALQGLVNRAGPLFYLDYGNPWDQPWLDLYARRNGLTYQRLPGFREALQHFAPTASGLVVYDPAVDGSRCVALSLAGVDDVLPVSPALLEGCATELLAGQDWAGVDFAAAPREEAVNWRLAVAQLAPSPDQGFWLTEANPNPGEDWGFMSYGPVTIDLDRYPLLEVQVAALEGPGAGWMIKLTWDRNADGQIAGHEDDLCLPLQHQPGTQRWNIRELSRLSGRHTFALIQLHVAGGGARVLWRRVRFVSPEGVPPPPTQPRPLPELLNLPVVQDFRGKFKNSVEAYAWALQHVLPRCNRRFAHAVDGYVDGFHAGYCQMAGFDWPVMHGGFVFNLCAVPTVMESYGGSKVGGSPEQAEMYRRILAALEPPAMITGYGEPEGEWCTLISQYGHYSFHFGPNWSFHTQIKPRGKTIRQRHSFTPNNVKPQPEKFYVCFMTSEGDTMKGPIPFFYGSWFEAERGSVPMNWGINPLMARYFPAMLEYFYETATPNDGFFAGCSGAGYCYPDVMPNLDQFARHTAEACQEADLSWIDAWGMTKREVLQRYAALTRPAGLTINAAPARMDVLPGGVPVVYHELAYWQHMFLGTPDFPQAFSSDEKRAEAVRWVVTRVEDIARRLYPPAIILVYSDLHNYAHHCSLHAEMARALDQRRFKPARLDEAFAALRKWADGRVLIGCTGVNERIRWTVLADTATRVPLHVANASSRRVSAEVAIAAGPVSRSLRVNLDAGESLNLRDFSLAVPADRAPGAVSITVKCGRREDCYQGELRVVPHPEGLSVGSCELAGVWPATTLRHNAGKQVADEEALFGYGWATPSAPGEATHVVFGPYTDVRPGRYLACFRLKLPTGVSPGVVGEGLRPVSLATLEVFAGGWDGLGKVLASRDISATELLPAGEYCWLSV
ncbi:MAG: GxGYxYP family putative glycoside hydrolase, partial [Armatimonadetes bacterium]|nr:GxGYxYP family putative glycoside hydrolase [Armatimonadota bacterium]